MFLVMATDSMGGEIILARCSTRKDAAAAKVSLSRDGCYVRLRVVEES